MLTKKRRFSVVSKAILNVLSYYDIGYGSDVKECIAHFKDASIKQNIRGRMSPSVLMLESVEYIEDKIKYFIDCGVTSCVVIGADSETPKKNIEAFVKAVWKYGNQTE